MKKWLAILLATVLVLGLGTAMAAQQELDGTTTTTGAIALQTTPTVTETVLFAVTYDEIAPYTYTWSTTADGTDGKYHWTTDKTAKTITVTAQNQGSATKTVKATWTGDTTNLGNYGLTATVATGTNNMLFATGGILLEPNSAQTSDTITVQAGEEALKTLTGALAGGAAVKLGDLTISIE